jgi:hypothetical protein
MGKLIKIMKQQIVSIFFLMAIHGKYQMVISNLNADRLLLSASVHGNINEIKAAIKAGANPRAINNTGVTPVGLAKRQEYQKL